MGFVELLTFLNYSQWLMSWWLFFPYLLIYGTIPCWLAANDFFVIHTFVPKVLSVSFTSGLFCEFFSLFGLTVVVSYGFYRWRLLILLQKWNKIVSEVTEKKITSEFDINTLSTSGKCASRKCAGTWKYGHPFADAS